MIVLTDVNITINGRKPSKLPSSIAVARNKLWNQSAGRGLTGDFVGSLVCWKYRLDITWQHLSENEASELAQMLEPAFINITFRDPRTKSMITKNFYAGDETYTVYNYTVKDAVYESLPISLVEV